MSAKKVEMGASVTRAKVAATILSGMIVSAPLCDRTKINKRKWVRIALEWADLLLAESGQ